MATNQRQLELTGLLKKYAAAYYEQDAPHVSDKEYDELYDELLALEAETGVVLEGSPTVKVGAEVSRGFKAHTHLARLWSLDKVRTMQELIEWDKRVRRLYNDSAAGNEKVCYALEYKFDGLTVNLTYNDGKLVNAATRGNGVTGEGIFEQVKTIEDIPHAVAYKGLFEVQGECYMKLSVFKELNKILDEPLKNARNAAAGALRNLDVSVTKARKLSCCCYNVGYIEGRSFLSQDEMRSFMKENSLPLSDFYIMADNIVDFSPYLSEAEEKRDTLDFLIDGMVIKARPRSIREALGYTEKFPRWAIAYKFQAEEVSTVIENITWEVGRTGKLTPLAHVEEVELGGATIRRATLNNYDDILRKRAGIGARVFIRRSNDVIPEILGCAEGGEPEELAKMPTQCPACGAHVEQRGAHIFCTNSLSCKPQIAGRIKHFASRDAMDIEFLASKTAEQMIDNLGVMTVPELYSMTKERLALLPGFKDKKINNLLAAIESSKECSLGAFIYALGIPNIGKKTAFELAKKFGAFENFRNASVEELTAIEDIGAIMAKSVADFFADSSIARQIDMLLELGVTPGEEQIKDGNLPLSGKTIVITGTLPTLGRREAEQLVADNGGKAAGSVSKNTDYVVYGESAGSKLVKARELNIPLLDESEFLKMITKR